MTVFGKITGLIAIALTSTTLASCGAPAEAPATDASTEPAMASATGTASPMATAIANLQTSEGKAAGTASAMQDVAGVQLSLRVEGLPPGAHGVHVHMTGKCEGPKFESAGGHWNPASKQHGLENPKGQHAGDMPNLTVGPDGRGTVSYTLKGGTIESLLDSDGAAMVVHASADDQKTDPSGDSGDRIACGVFSAG